MPSVGRTCRARNPVSILVLLEWSSEDFAVFDRTKVRSPGKVSILVLLEWSSEVIHFGPIVRTYRGVFQSLFYWNGLLRSILCISFETTTGYVN